METEVKKKRKNLSERNYKAVLVHTDVRDELDKAMLMYQTTAQKNITYSQLIRMMCTEFMDRLVEGEDVTD